MTAVPSPPLTGTTQGVAVNRIGNVVRLHFTNKWTMVATPAVIMGIIFLVNLAIWAIINRAAGDNADEAISGTQFSGAASFIFIYMLVVAVQAINTTFPFALGYGVTRRDFYLGSSLVFVLLSAGWSIALAVLSYIEEATNGWGLGGHIFTSVLFGSEGVGARLFVFFAGFLFFFFLGAAVATIYMRWRMNGMIVFWTLSAMLLVGLVALATFTESWPLVGAWFVANGVVGVVAWSLVVTAIAGVTGFFVLRRATPKN